MRSSFWPALTERITAATATPATVLVPQPLGGGCINTTFRLGDWFVKLNRGERAGMFEAEALALAELAASGTVRVPLPVCHGQLDDRAYLVLEYLPLQALSANAAEALGWQLAALHATPRPWFGWTRDNTLGITPQPNAQDTDWCRFWRDQRLAPQLRLAADQGHGGALQRQGERLLLALDALLADHRPTPALLHGDLWGGNAAMTLDGQPVIFDPASYYGDREADLAMTELFGGFGSPFQAAYRDACPLDEGYPLRRELYNLYHILNHLNLFGGGYRFQAERMMSGLLALVN